MENLWSQFVALADGVKLSLLMSLIFGNFLTGLAVSIYKKTFVLKQVADFLYSRVLPYVISYLAVVAVAVVDEAWQPAVIIVWGVILAALVGAILANLKEMGVNIPDFLGGDNK